MLGGHSAHQYKTGTRLQACSQSVQDPLAERCAHHVGNLAELKQCGTEVIVLLEGSLHFRRRADGRLQGCDAVPGTTWLCPAGGAEDLVRLSGDIHEIIHLDLPGPVGMAATAELDRPPERPCLRYEGSVRDPLIEANGHAIASEMQARGELSGLQVQALSSALGRPILRKDSRVPPGMVPLSLGKGALDARRLARVLAFIDARLDRSLRLEHIAREVCFSPFHLARAFKAATRCSLHRHVALRRLAVAKAALARLDCAIVDIALACGFSSHAHPSSGFKRATGMTPSTFRRAMCGRAAQ